MWNKEKSKTDLQRFNGKTSLIAVGAELQGNLRFQGEGQVEGEVSAPHVLIDGEVIGDVHASAHLELGARARVRGNLYYGLMEMAMGAQIEGRLCHLRDEVRPLELPENLDLVE